MQILFTEAVPDPVPAVVAEELLGEDVAVEAEDLFGEDVAVEAEVVAVVEAAQAVPLEAEVVPVVAVVEVAPRSPNATAAAAGRPIPIMDDDA